MLHWLLTANIDNFRAGRQYLRNTGGITDHWFLIVAVVTIIGFWVGLYYWDRHRKQVRRGGDTPKALFLELASVHRLSRADRSLLWNASEAAKLEQPATIFVNPDILAEISAGNREDAGAYEQLRERLFGRNIDD